MQKLFIGLMGAGKSAKLINDVKDLPEFMTSIVIGPSSSKKIKSRNGQEVNVDYTFDELKELMDGIEEVSELKTDHQRVFVDECQFLTLEQAEFLVNNWSDIRFYGLDTLVFNEKIEVIEYLKSKVDSVQTLTSSCRICGKEASLHIPMSETGTKDERFMVLCESCFENLKKTFNKVNKETPKIETKYDYLVSLPVSEYAKEIAELMAAERYKSFESIYGTDAIEDRESFMKRYIDTLAPQAETWLNTEYVAPEEDAE